MTDTTDNIIPPATPAPATPAHTTYPTAVRGIGSGRPGVLAATTIVALDALRTFLAAHPGSSLSYAARECGVSKGLAQSLVTRGYLPAPWPRGRPRDPEAALVLRLVQRGAELREPVPAGAALPPLTLDDIATYPPRGPTEAEARAELERLRSNADSARPPAQKKSAAKTGKRSPARGRGRPRKTDQTGPAKTRPDATTATTATTAATADGGSRPRELPDKTPWDDDDDNPEIAELRRHIKIMMTRNMGNAGAIAKYAAALKSLVGVREDEQGHEIETGNKATIYVPGQDRGIEDE